MYKNEIKNLNKTNIILGGDWNLILEQEKDKRGGNMETHNSCRMKLIEITVHLLIDILRTMYPILTDIY